MAPQILLIDNYDSFVFNLARYFEELGTTTLVVRNDAISVDEVRRLAPAAIVISPGPCTPDEAGISQELIRELHPSIPILGVCLGHQAIASALGGRVIRAQAPVHGRTASIRHSAQGLFKHCPNPMLVARYHSLLVSDFKLPSCLEVTSKTDSGLVMSLQHRSAPLYGVQFHPESILTQSGHRLLANFLSLAGIEVSRRDFPSELHPKVSTTDDFYQRQIAPDAWRPL